MKVYILTTNPFPIGLAATNRILCYAKGIISNGLECEVIIMNRTERSDVGQYNFNHKGVFEGVPYFYVANSVLRSRSFFKRRIDDMWDYLKTIYFCAAKINEDDVLVSYYSKISFFVPLLFVSKLKKYKIIRELCEYPQGTVNDSSYHKLLRKFELKFLFPRFSGFLAISRELENLALKHCNVNAKVVKIPILVEPINTQKAYIHSKPFIFHCGTMYERKDGIISTMKAFAIAAKKLNYSIDFIIAGPKSSSWSELENIIKTNNIENNVIFLGRLPKNEISKYQLGAGLSILNKNDNIQNRCGFSTKLGEILLSETPVITTTVGEANYYLKDSISAYIVEPHDYNLIAEKIVHAFSNEDERLRIGKEGKIIAETYFDYKYQGAKLVSYFNSLF